MIFYYRFEKNESVVLEELANRKEKITDTDNRHRNTVHKNRLVQEV